MLNDAVTRLAPDQARLARRWLMPRFRNRARHSVATIRPPACGALSFDYALLLAVSDAEESVAQAALEAVIAQQLLEEHPTYTGATGGDTP